MGKSKKNLGRVLRNGFILNIFEGKHEKTRRDMTRRKYTGWLDTGIYDCNEA